VLARRRFEISGRFGLRAGPGGIVTPAFGDGPEALRISGAVLVHERAGEARYMPLEGATLRELGAYAGADLGQAFSCGEDTPDVGDLDAPLELAGAEASVLAEWFDLGARTLDRTLCHLGTGAEPATVQLWPEHFDLGTNVALGSERRANLGASPGDGFSQDPYLYLGPWGSERPGDPGFWNAPFGAVLRWSEMRGSDDPVADGVRFLERGIDLLRRS
jgi:hypothetical protein